MSTMKVKESKFGAPAGIYTARFLGVKPFQGDGKPRLGRDGKPMGPAVEWSWEIVEGPSVGQVVGRLTSPEPTIKKACGTLLSGLIGRVLRADEEADPDQYIGQIHQVVIGSSKDNPEKTHVVQVVQLQQQTTAATQSPPARPMPPPPRAAAPSTNGEAAATDARLAARYWVDLPTSPAGSPRRR